MGGGAVLDQAHRLSLLFLYYFLDFLALLGCGLRGWVHASRVALALLVHSNLQNLLGPDPPPTIRCKEIAPIYIAYLLRLVRYVPGRRSVQICVAHGGPFMIRRSLMRLVLIAVPLYRMPLVEVPMSSWNAMVHSNRISRCLYAISSVYTIDPIQ